jgi:hypothetical protein
MEVLDKLGKPITEGCFIAYGHALGRCAGLRIGKVLKVAPRVKTYGSDSGVSITVWGIDDEWSHSPVTLCKTKGTLLFPDRIVVLDREQVRKEYRDLLDLATLDATFKSLGSPEGVKINRDMSAA